MNAPSHASMTAVAGTSTSATPCAGWCGVALRYFVLVTACLGLAGYLTIYSRDGADQPVHSDGYSYYVYIPSVLLYHDTSLDALARDWYGGEYPGFTGIRRWPATGRFLNPHPIGTAVLMTPFVAVGHALTRWSNLPADGFSLFYQHSAALAGLFYMLAGLAVLRRTLSRHFSPPVTLATLVVTTWGTNLFHYGVVDGAFSHVFSFFLVAALIESTERWWESPALYQSVMLGVIAALLFLTRHTDAIFLALVPLYGVTSGARLLARPTELWARRGPLALVACVATAGVLPQLVLYRRATGVWLASPYGAVGAGFTFSAPHLMDVLFSTQKGLFFWSPACLLAVTGFFVARGPIRQFLLGAIVALAADTWLIASWSDWQFGASYGHRAFVDATALLAIFIASCLAWTAGRPRGARVVYAFAALAVLLSVVQMVQYWMGIIPPADTTWAQYRALFLRFS